MTPRETRLLRVQTVAHEYLDCSVRHVWSLIAAGKLTAIKIGARSTRIEATEVERFIKAARVQS